MIATRQHAMIATLDYNQLWPPARGRRKLPRGAAANTKRAVTAIFEGRAKRAPSSRGFRVEKTTENWTRLRAKRSARVDR